MLTLYRFGDRWKEADTYITVMHTYKCMYVRIYAWQYVCVYVHVCKCMNVVYVYVQYIICMYK